MKQARPLQENNRRTSTRETRSTANVKKDVTAALKSAFGDKITANAKGLQKENDQKPMLATQKRTREAHRKHIEAGQKRVGPDTPVGKISARIKRLRRDDKNEQAKANTPSKSDIDSILIEKIAEAKDLYCKAGLAAARKFMETFTSKPGLSSCRTKLSYWTACIDIEREAKQWDRVAELFERARLNISCTSSLLELQVMLDAFEQEADDLYEEERERLDQSLLETLSDSEDLISVMAGRSCTNEAPRSITAPAPKALHFLDELKTRAQKNHIKSTKNAPGKPRMRF